MGISLASFESSPVPPNPTSAEIQALAGKGAEAPKPDRVATMNSIGAIMGIPNGGWSAGQSRLFEHGDVRVVWLLRRLAREGLASAVAQNVDRVTKFVDVDVMLAVTSAARESKSSIGALSTDPINTFDEGGMDHLWKQKNQLGLPASVTSTWQQVTPFISSETHHLVNPALIPARDQLLAYAAQMNASYRNTSNRHAQWVREKSKTSSTACRVAALIWKAYAFLSPGGSEYDEKATFASQIGQGFGCFKALTYLTLAPPVAETGGNYLNQILTDVQLNKVEWVRIAKARVAEALFLEHLLRAARAVLRPT